MDLPQYGGLGSPSPSCPQTWEDPKGRTPNSEPKYSFGGLLKNPKVDLLIGSAQGSRQAPVNILAWPETFLIQSLSDL